ncbi:MAG: glycosyltransferase family 4 protein [Candidatus Saccharimonadales bacterium]
MTIGINIKPLQSGHRMRGIGSVIINLINNLSPADRKKHNFIFYMAKDKDEDEALGLLNLGGLDYRVHYLPKPRALLGFRLPGRLNLLVILANKGFGFARLNRGMTLPQHHDLDVYLHTDQSENLPGGRGFKKVMIAYDIIPYVLEWEYLNSFRTLRRRGYRPRTAFRVSLSRWGYKQRLEANIRRVDRILAISSATKDDFIKYMGASARKIEVVHLGVTPPAKQSSDAPGFRYLPTSWGYFKRERKFDTDTPFLLYVGGADPRRKLDDLVTAFNHLRAEGQDIKLVLVGDTLQGPKTIPTLPIQTALDSSSYIDDIIFLGFVDEEVRNWLYEHALAFVYPSTYEGFGLPVLESMAHGCPVICYDTAAVREVAGDLPHYAEDAEDIRQLTLKLLDSKPEARRKLQAAGLAHSRKFTWAKTAAKVMSALEEAAA